MPNVKLDHCVIHVSDWEISNTFYRDVLGYEQPVHRCRQRCGGEGDLGPFTSGRSRPEQKGQHRQDHRVGDCCNEREDHGRPFSA